MPDTTVSDRFIQPLSGSVSASLSIMVPLYSLWTVYDVYEFDVRVRVRESLPISFCVGS